LSVQTKPIFIIGCPRSGTTIIGKFFENNSKILFFNEVELWDKNVIIANQSIFRKLIIKLWRIIRKIIPATMFVRKKHWQTTELLRAVNIMDQEKSHRFTESDVTEEMIDQVKYILKKELTPEKTLVVKNVNSSVRIPFIKKLFPHARFVHVIRDGRDVACSLGRGNEGSMWMHTKPTGWNNLQKKIVGPERGAWIWNTIINTVKEDVKKLPSENFYEIRYEDLVTNPEKTMQMLFNILGLPFEEPQKQLCQKVSNQQKKEYLTNTYSDDWATFDHSVRIGRYKENLTPEMLGRVNSILGKTNSELGYF